MIDVHILHFTLGITLFYIINWIGRHSYSVGYMEISMFLKVEEAPAFNFLIRIISPVVYLFIVSALLYKIGFDRFVSNAYFISIYYIIFRLAFNLITGRRLLMNWYRQVLYWISIMTVSYFAYTEIIYKKENILPDFETISNELWIVILIFLFHTLNQIRVSSDKTAQRKNSYLKHQLSNFREKYADLVDEIIDNDKLRSITYAIMIYENFNRPKVARIVENIRFLLTGKKHSLGLMQVQSNKLINDRTSVELGANKIKNAYNYHLAILRTGKGTVIGSLTSNPQHAEWWLERKIIANYNKDESYVYEVQSLTEIIFELSTSSSLSYLIPNYKGEKSKYSSFEEEH